MCGLPFVHRLRQMMFHIATWLKSRHEYVVANLPRPELKWLVQKYTKTPARKSKGQRKSNSKTKGEDQAGGDGQQNISDPASVPVNNASLLQSAGFTSVASVQPWYCVKCIDGSGNITEKTPPPVRRVAVCAPRTACHMV